MIFAELARHASSASPISHLASPVVISPAGRSTKSNPTRAFGPRRNNNERTTDMVLASSSAVSRTAGRPLADLSSSAATSGPPLPSTIPSPSELHTTSSHDPPDDLSASLASPESGSPLAPRLDGAEAPGSSTRTRISPPKKSKSSSASRRSRASKDKKHAFTPHQQLQPLQDDDGVTASCQASRFSGLSEDGPGGCGLSAPVVLRDLSIEAAGRVLLEGASLTLTPDRRYGLIGANGSGKTTLLRQLAAPGALVPVGVKTLLVRQQDALGSTGDVDLTALQVVASADESLASALDAIQLIEAALSGVGLSPAAALATVEAKRLRAQATRLEAALSRSSGARAKELRTKWSQADAAASAAESSLVEITKSGSAVADSDFAAAEAMLDDLQTDLLEATGETVAEAIARAEELLTGLGFSEDGAAGTYGYNTTATSVLSGGWRMRVALARALFAEPALLLIDEPSNHLDLSTARWLQEWLAESLPAGTCLIVSSHDSDFLDGFATDILRITPGLKLEVHAGMDYSAYAEARAARSASAARESAAMSRKKATIEKSMEQMMSKVADKKILSKRITSSAFAGNRKGDKDPHNDPRQKVVRARRKKLEERWGADHNDHGSRFKLSRDMAGHHQAARPGVAVVEDDPEAHLVLQGAPPLGSHGPFLQLEDVSVGWAGASASSPAGDVVLSGVTLALDASTRLGIVGDNGSGKSTLLACISAALNPRQGTRVAHPNLRIAHFTQHHEREVLSLTAEEQAKIGPKSGCPSAVELLMVRFGAKALDCRAHVAKFGLKGRLGVQPLAELSGGEKARAALAVLFWQPPHLLLLDEPTNHMDMSLVAALTEALQEVDCGIVACSHHRRFLLDVCEELQEVKDGRLHRIPADSMEEYLLS